MSPYVPCTVLAAALWACAPSVHSTQSVPESDLCSLEAWRARHQEYAALALVTGDSLDHRLLRQRGGPRPLPRPVGFPPGHEARVVVAVIVDTAGKLVFTEPVATRIEPSRDSVRLHRGFEESAVDLLRAAPFERPTRNGQAVTVFQCLPVDFREGS